LKKDTLYLVLAKYQSFKKVQRIQIVPPGIPHHFLFHDTPRPQTTCGSWSQYLSSIFIPSKPLSLELFFFFLAVLEFELRTSYLLGRRSTLESLHQPQPRTFFPFQSNQQALLTFTSLWIAPR
jgi:hypothetical protein